MLRLTRSLQRSTRQAQVAEQYGAVTIADILALNPELEGNTTPANVTIQLPCQSEQGLRPPGHFPADVLRMPLSCAALASALPLHSR